MWFNSSRTHQFAFDRVVSEYDGTRLRFDVGLVAAMAEAAGLGRDASVFEVGAGTGQLTRALLDYGFSVRAAEPAPVMREVLAEIGHPALSLSSEPFESEPLPVEPYAAIFAANSFHWIRPEVAFAKAQALLAPGGALGLVWNFAFLDPGIQERLNRSAFVGHDDLIQDPALSVAAFEGVMAAGRELITASGRFGTPWWEWRRSERELSAVDYADLAVSYASTAALSPDARDALQERILDDLADLGATSVTTCDYVYACVARALPVPVQSESACIVASTERASASTS